MATLRNQEAKEIESPTLPLLGVIKAWASCLPAVNCPMSRFAPSQVRQWVTQASIWTAQRTSGRAERSSEQGLGGDF